LETAASSVCIVIAIPVLSLIFASSWLFITIADRDLTQELAAFNTDVEKSDGKDHNELVRRFCNIIKLYSDAKE
jgi:hypothetical protein